MESLAKSLDVLPQLLKQLTKDFVLKTDISLKKAEFHTLMQIKLQQGKTMKYYSEKIDLFDGSFTYIADKLEKKELIKRVIDETDKRKKILILTELGNKVITQIQNQFEEHLIKKLELIDENDKKELFAAIDSLSNIYNKLRNLENK